MLSILGGRCVIKRCSLPLPCSLTDTIGLQSGQSYAIVGFLINFVYFVIYSAYAFCNLLKLYLKY